MSASILVALDLAHEEVSAGLLKRAAQIADLDEAQLSVVTVVPDFGTSFVASFFEEDAMKAALAKVQATKCFDHCARSAAHLQGGSAYVKGNRVESLYRHVLSLAIPGGSEDVMIDAAARLALKGRL